MLKLYTTNCPKCKILEQLLQEKGFTYEKILDEDLMISKGFMSAPILEDGDKTMTFPEAMKYLKGN